VLVLDASVVIELLLRTRATPQIDRRVLVPGETWHAPHLLDLEVAQVLRRYVSTRQVAAVRGRTALEDLAVLPVTRYRHTVLLPRIWELRANATAYDASYLALAEALDAPLLTRDVRLASVPGHHAAVEVL
jgi:predicted nucleic acid-binding protein